MSNFLNRQQNLSLLGRFSIFVIITTCVFSLTGLFGGRHWLLDLTSHFPLQYLVVQLMAFLIILYRKPREYLTYSLILLSSVCINAYQLYSYYWPRQESIVAKADYHHLKILHMNVFVFNGNYKAVADALKTTDAHLVSLQEINGKWLQELKKAGGLKDFPYQLIHLESGNILASRLPLLEPRIIPIEEGRLGALIGKNAGGILIANIQLTGKPVTLINMHPPIPLTPKYEASYLRYFKQLEAHKSEFSPDKVLIGDLNTTPWSSYYQRYLQTLNLKDARAYQGFYPTWNAYLPVFAIPIDHVFVSDNFITSRQSIGPFTGSDHLPVYVDLVFKAK